MNYNIDEIPVEIKTHLAGLINEAGLADDEKSLIALSENWIRKMTLFEEQANSLCMKSNDNFKKNEKNGALVLTYSGSLISLGASENEQRDIEYASIKIRSDVPDILKVGKASVANDFRIGDSIELFNSSLKKTSAIYKIKTFESEINLAEQNKRLREAMIFLTNSFVKLNRAVILDDNSPDQFDLKSVVAFISKKNNITQGVVRQIFDDYFSMVETGLLLNERVSLGPIGNFHLKKREAQKARVIKNPQTGEDMTVPAKAEKYVPRVSFSSTLKDKIEKIDIEE